jgi:hypothetical protein
MMVEACITVDTCMMGKFRFVWVVYFDSLVFVMVIGCDGEELGIGGL